jgi:hypothetical protein
MQYIKTWMTGSVAIILILFLSSGMILAQSSEHYSIKKATLDIGGGSVASDQYQVIDAAGQSEGIGATVSAEYRECGGFFAGYIVVTQVEKPETEIPAKFELYQNYPNPFNPETTIQFEVMRPCQVTLTVFDLLGRQTSTLIHDRYNPGVYSITFDASVLSSGVYFYKIQMDTYRAVRKMIVLE